MRLSSLQNQVYRPLRGIAVINFTLWMCLMMLLLAGCSGQGGSSSAPAKADPTPKAQAQDQAQATKMPDSMKTETKSEAALRKVQAVLNSMTLDQKLGQLLTVEYKGNNYEDSGLHFMVSQQFIGGYYYQTVNGNFDPPYNQISNLAAFSHQAQQDAKIPLLIGTDQEGGLVSRLETFHGPLPSAQDMGASGNPSYAYDQGKQWAIWMRELGMNTDLAPVVDVQTVDPPVLASRMFGRNSKTVSTYAGAFIDGLQQNHVLGCLKHFPGLGSINSDPHFGLPTVNRSKADLENIDFAPYKTMLKKNNPAMVMVTDVLDPALDPKLPAELSPKTVNGILRGELGYNGVVFSDDLNMGGISQTWNLSQATVLSLVAGVDMIEGPFNPHDVATIVTGLKQALQSGQLTQARIDLSVQRILLMKLRFGMLN